jgi:hypothetical protein
LYEKWKVAKHRWLTPVTLATQEAEVIGSWFKASPRQIVLETLSRKYSTQNTAGGVAQEGKHLHETLGTNPGTTKTTTTKNKVARKRGKI